MVGITRSKVLLFFDFLCHVVELCTAVCGELLQNSTVMNTFGRETKHKAALRSFPAKRLVIPIMWRDNITIHPDLLVMNKCKKRSGLDLEFGCFIGVQG